MYMCLMMCATFILQIEISITPVKTHAPAMPDDEVEETIIKREVLSGGLDLSNLIRGPPGPPGPQVRVLSPFLWSLFENRFNSTLHSGLVYLY